VVFGFVRTIAFDIFGTLNSAQEHRVIPFSAIFALWYSRVHVSTSNDHDILFNIEASVDKALSPATTLNILNIYPNDRHVGFR